MMRRRRPTVPLLDWRIALHLETTRLVQNHPNTSAYGCDCSDCSAWRLGWKNNLPLQISTELQRMGVEIEHPSDLYAYPEKTHEGLELETKHCRVTFHCVGKILSGPLSWREIPKMGSWGVAYQTQTGILIALYPHKYSHLKGPINPNPEEGELLQIDIRLTVPPLPDQNDKSLP